MSIFTTIATAISGWVASLTATQLFILRIVSAIAFNAIAAAFTKKEQPKAPGIRGTVQVGADLPRSFILGRYATAGSMVYRNSWGKSGKTPNAYYTEVIAISDLPSKTITGLWINDTKTGIEWGSPDADGKGFPLTEYSVTKNETTTETFYEGGDEKIRFVEAEVTDVKAWIKFYDGTQSTADSFLTTDVSTAERPWDSDAIGTGITYAVLTYKFDREVFQGFPRALFEIDGYEQYCPDDDDTGTSDRVAGVIAYTITKGITYGGQWFYGPQTDQSSLVDDDQWATEIAKCKIAPPGTSGMTSQEILDTFYQSTVPERYRAGIEISVNERPTDILKEVLAGCNGRISNTGWKYRFQVGDPDTSSLTFSDDDIYIDKEQKADHLIPLADRVNGVTATFPDPQSSWQNQSAPPLYNSTYETLDGGRRLVAQIPFRAVSDHEQIQRLMQISLNEYRNGRLHSIPCPPNFAKLEPGDIVTWNSVRHGYTSKTFRVDGYTDKSNGDIELAIREVDASVYGVWNASTDYNAGLPPSGGVLRPPAESLSGFAVAPAQVWDNAGVARYPAIKLSWALVHVGVSGILYQIRQASNGAVVYQGQTNDYFVGVLIHSIGLAPLSDYEVRAKILPFGGRLTEWTDWEAVTTDDIDPGVRTVNLNTPDQVFAYDQAGANPAPTTATFTATAYNGRGTIYYDFLVDGVSVQNTTSNTYVYTPEAAFGDMPQVVEVKLREGTDSSTVLASDFVTVIPLKTNSNTLNSVLSNEADVLPANSSGVVTSYADSGTRIQVFEGAEELTYNGSGTTPGTYTVSPSVVTGTITVGGISVNSGDALVANHSAMSGIRAVIRYSITGEMLDGTPFSITKDQTITAVSAGTNGNPGSPGSAGQDALAVWMDGQTRTVPASSTGVVSSYADSGCKIWVAEGETELNYITSTSSGALTNGSWQIYSVGISPSGDITVGSRFDGGSEAIVANHSGMDNSTNSVLITYYIRIKRQNGNLETRIIEQTITKAIAGADGNNGDPGAAGLNNATVTLFRKNTSPTVPPSDPSGTFTYTFSTKALSGGSFNGWSQTAPSLSNGEYLWVIRATASSTSATDSISSSEFSNAAVEGIGGQNGNPGDPGDPGTSVAFVSLYRKSSSGVTAPSDPTGTFTFTFATGALSGGTLNGWSQTAPTIGAGEFLWQITATAASSGPTDSISSSEFSDAVVVSIGGTDGDPGTNGQNTAVVTLYQANGSSSTPPSDPTGTHTYTFATGALTGGNLNGWSLNRPTVAAGQFLWAIQATAVSAGTTDTISSAEFSGAVVVSGTGTNGTNGLNTATVFLFRKNTSTTPPSDPTGTFTYTFATGVLSGGGFNGWSQIAPNLNKGEYLFMIQATASSTGTTDTISATEFADARIIGIGGEDGDQGDQGETVIDGFVYYGTLQQTAPAKPSASSYNVATGTFSGLTAGWSRTRPTIDATTNVNNKEWRSEYHIVINNVTSAQTITFTNPAGTVQFSTNIQSDNFNGAINGSGVITNPGTAGWAMTRNGGNIVINSLIARGTMESSNFVDEVSGWQVDNDGSAQFNDILITGGKFLVTFDTSPIDTTVEIDPSNNSYAVIYGIRHHNTHPTATLFNTGTAEALWCQGGGDTILAAGGGGAGTAVITAHNDATGGGLAQLGLSSANGGYAFNAVDGGYYDGSGNGYNPFTGRHEGLVPDYSEIEPGDILCDDSIIARGLSDSLCSMCRSSKPNDPSAAGVYVKHFPEWHSPYGHTPAALRHLSEEELLGLRDLYDLVTFNALGEGAVNVCGENGNLKRGDLIVTSSVPGKGMKQADDIIRPETVAKVREDVTFDSPQQVKLVACFYRCG